MKKDIHPNVSTTKMVCHCGYEAELKTVGGERIDVEICANCHPFYTGKQRFVDTAGRIDRFKKKYGDFGIKKS